MAISSGITKRLVSALGTIIRIILLRISFLPHDIESNTLASFQLTTETSAVTTKGRESSRIFKTIQYASFLRLRGGEESLFPKDFGLPPLDIDPNSHLTTGSPTNLVLGASNEGVIDDTVTNNDLPYLPVRATRKRSAAAIANLTDISSDAYEPDESSEKSFAPPAPRATRGRRPAAAKAAAKPAAKPATAPPKPAPAPPKPKPAPAANVCPHCQARFDKPMKFCGECGKPMDAPAQEANA